MNILFAPFGTEGDVRPHVVFAHAMAARGHRITFLANPYFGKLITPNGWTLIPLDTEEAYRRDVNDPRVWRPVSGLILLMEIVRRALDMAWQALEGARFDLVVGNTVSFPAMTWAERAGVSRLVTHLQPMMMRSATDVPVLAQGFQWTTRLPPWAARAWFLAQDVAARPLMAPVNFFRRRHGLRTMHSFEALWRSAEGIAALFPAWLAAPQPDWPSNLRQFDTLRGAAHGATLPDLVERFLAEGQSPIVWTQGSYPTDVERFARRARAVTARLGARGIMIGLPAPGEDGRDFLHVPYASHAALLPRSRAFVHHGGIGTSFEAVAAGVPQLVVPRAADQIDNAHRLVRLGVAASLPPRQFDEATAAHALSALCASSAVAAACRDLRARFLAADPLPALCAYAEDVAARST
ncbi:MAG TPA: glycosyltransferase [Casimicrobiaceae bacterium]|nr:glycosyltransferase [Casimicrobiaceae bacterium]